MILLSCSDAKPTGEPSSVLINVSCLPQARGECLLVVGSGSPGLLLRGIVVFFGQPLDARAERFPQARRRPREGTDAARMWDAHGPSSDTQFFTSPRLRERSIAERSEGNRVRGRRGMCENREAPSPASPRLRSFGATAGSAPSPRTRGEGECARVVRIIARSPRWCRPWNLSARRPWRRVRRGCGRIFEVLSSARGVTRFD